MTININSVPTTIPTVSGDDLVAQVEAARDQAQAAAASAEAAEATANQPYPDRATALAALPDLPESVTAIRWREGNETRGAVRDPASGEFAPGWAFDRAVAVFSMVDYLHPADFAAAQAGNIAGQNVSRVTDAVQEMHDAFMAWWNQSDFRIARLVYPAGAFAINDELFSENFATALYGMGSSRSRNRCYMVFEGTVFDTTTWTQQSAVRTSGFFAEKGITYPVPKVVFRWMQSGGFAFCPAVSGTMHIRGGGSIATDPVGVMLFKVSKPRINNIRVSNLQNHQFMLEEAYNGDIAELDLAYGGFQPTEYGGAVGHISSTARFSNSGAVVTANEAVFNASHVGRFFCLAQAGATDQGIRLNFWATIQSVDSATQITLADVPDTNVTNQFASFEAMRVSGANGSNVLTMSAALSTSMVGRYVTIMRARTAISPADTATLTTVILEHDGDQITVAHALDGAVSNELLIFSPQLWLDSHPDHTGPARSDNINFPDLRAESSTWHSVASVPALIGRASLIDFTGAKLHGAANKHNNFGGSATIAAMGRATQITYSGGLTHIGHSPRYGAVMAVGTVDAVVQGPVTSYGDSTHAALFYVAPRTSSMPVSIVSGLMHPSTQFPRLSQAAVRLGPNGAASMVSAIGSARKNSGAATLLTTRLGHVEASLVSWLRPTVGGTANAITLSTGAAGYGSLPAGTEIRFRATAANTGATTIAIDGGSAQSCVTVKGTALPAGYIRTDVDTKAYWTGTAWVLDREAEHKLGPNGEWRRLADGRQECLWSTTGIDITTADGNLFRSAAITWTFEVPFYASSFGNNVGGPRVWGNVYGDNGLNVISRFGDRTTSASLYAWATVPKLAAGINVTAIGTWYAP